MHTNQYLATPTVGIAPDPHPRPAPRRSLRVRLDDAIVRAGWATAHIGVRVASAGLVRSGPHECVHPPPVARAR